MNDFQAQLKRHMDKGATYLEALRLIKTTESDKPSKLGQTLQKKAKEREKHSS